MNLSSFSLPLAAIASLAVLAAVSLNDTTEVALRLVPVLGFAAGMSVVVNLAARVHTFEWLVGALQRTTSRREIVLAGFLALCVAATAFLSLDTTAIMLTPLAVQLASRFRLPVPAVALSVVWIANFASMPLPVSNLTNLLAVGGDTFSTTGEYVKLAAVPAAVAVAVAVAASYAARAIYRSAAGEPMPEASSILPPPNGRPRDTGRHRPRTPQPDPLLADEHRRRHRNVVCGGPDRTARRHCSTHPVVGAQPCHCLLRGGDTGPADQRYFVRRAATRRHTPLSNCSCWRDHSERDQQHPCVFDARTCSQRSGQRAGSPDRRQCRPGDHPMGIARHTAVGRSTPPRKGPSTVARFHPVGPTPGTRYRDCRYRCTAGRCLAATMSTARCMTISNGPRWKRFSHNMLKATSSAHNAR